MSAGGAEVVAKCHGCMVSLKHPQSRRASKATFPERVTGQIKHDRMTDMTLDQFGVIAMAVQVVLPALIVWRLG